MMSWTPTNDTCLGTEARADNSRSGSDDEADSVWGFVTTRKEAGDRSEDEEGSLMVVSRGSSPWPVEFHSTRTSVPRPLTINWPSTLPWMQFQALHLLSQTRPPPRRDGNQNSLTAIHSTFGNGKKRNAEGVIVNHQSTSLITHQTLVTAIGSRSVARAVAKAKTIDIAVAEVAKSMPEAYDGEHPATLRAIASGSEQEAQMTAFKMLIYQVSNNLIESELGEDDCDDDQYWRIVDSFREIGLPRESWVETFTKQQDRSSRAFAEKLFEAAVNTEDLALMEALLDSGISPDQPVWTNMNCWHERPIQLSADNRVQNFDMAALLIKAGAKVDAITEANDQPAVHIAARAARLDIVKLLVESGADIYRDARDPTYTDKPSWTIRETPMIHSLISHYWELIPFDDDESEDESEDDSEDESEDDSKEESEDASKDESEDESEDGQPNSDGLIDVFHYLLELHLQGTRPFQDKEIIQDSLVLAATRASAEVILALIEAGGDVSEPNGRRITPLMAAASQMHHEQTVHLLLAEGAPVNEPPTRASALHLAALVGVPDVPETLIECGADINAAAKLSSQVHDILLPNRGRTLRAGLYTPLQLALHIFRFGKHRKPSCSALTLLRAGAQLVGGELVDAARFCCVPLVAEILDHGADPNEKAQDGRTALQILLTGDVGHDSHVDNSNPSVRFDNCRQVVGVLLDAGALVRGGEMYSAFRLGDPEMVNLLAKNGARFSDTGPAGETILEAAYACLSQPLISLAVEEGAVPYDSGALCMVVYQEATNVERVPQGSPSLTSVDVKKLLERRTLGQINPLLEATALGIAVYQGCSHTVQRLLGLEMLGEWCVIPITDDPEDYTDIFWNKTSFRISFRRALVASCDKGEAITGFWHKENLIRCSVLVYALQRPEEWDTVRALLKTGYQPCPLSLLVAVMWCTPGQVHELINCGGNVNQAWRHNAPTALQLAVKAKRVDTVRVLLRLGADVNALPATLVPAFDKFYEEPNELRPRSALQAAVENGHLELIDILLEAGADVNGAVSQDAGASCLQLAAAKGFIGIAKRLLELGADVNCPRAETFGRTAVEAAAEMGRLDMVQFLLENGVDTKGIDAGTGNMGNGVYQWLRAIRFARRGGHGAVAELLEEWRDMTMWERRCLEWSRLLEETFEVPGLEDVEWEESGWSDDTDDQSDDELMEVDDVY